MSTTITNFRAAVCAVDVSPLLGSPPGIPRFKGQTPREFANAGFGPFAAYPAADRNSERVAQGMYRLHVTQPFSFTGGEATPFATLNTTADELWGNEIAGIPGINPDFPGIIAEGTDYGEYTDVGCDVWVTIGSPGDGGDDGFPYFNSYDSDFSLFVVQFPQQHTE